MHNYHDEHGSFPPAYIADEHGKPIHSWRVLMLPYLGGEHIHARYDFDEPWDGPHNRKLAASSEVREWARHAYHCPSCPSDDSITTYVAVVGQSAAFLGAETRTFQDIEDGSSNTIFAVEVADSGIHWMEPRDLDFDQIDLRINASPRQGLSSGHVGTACVMFGDGGVQSVPEGTSEELLRALLTIDAGEPVGAFFTQ